MYENIKVVAFDCDGILTDSGLYYSDSGYEMKQFNVKDGLGIKMLLKAEYELILISARYVRLVEKRMEDLGVTNVHLGISYKLKVLEEFLKEKGYGWEETAYLGDDLTDLQILKRAGLPVTAADAVDEVKEAAKIITEKNGGAGAFREFSDLLLKKSGKFQRVLTEMNFV